jgi:uncharacterized protein (DUF1330 family)
MEFTPEQLAAQAAADDGTPVVMLNLVAYRGGTGIDEYLRYSRGFVPLLKACGGTILWAGDVTGVALGDEATDDWDYAVLVQYPSRASFVEVMQSPAYAAINEHRLAGLRKHIILPVSETYSKFAASNP